MPSLTHKVLLEQEEEGIKKIFERRASFQVGVPGTPTLRSEINESIWNSLLLWERLIFTRELAYIKINTSPNTWRVQTAKHHKKRPFMLVHCTGCKERAPRRDTLVLLKTIWHTTQICSSVGVFWPQVCCGWFIDVFFFQARRLCQGAMFMSRTGRNFENSRGCIFNTKDDIELETCEQIYFYVFLHLVTIKNLADLASIDFRILGRHVQTRNCWQVSTVSTVIIKIQLAVGCHILSNCLN